MKKWNDQFIRGYGDKRIFVGFDYVYLGYHDRLNSQTPKYHSNILGVYSMYQR